MLSADFAAHFLKLSATHVVEEIQKPNLATSSDNRHWDHDPRPAF
jgi:hypothetical protein